MIRSEEFVEIQLADRNYKLKRWQAERLGVLPVTVLRCIEGFTNGGQSLLHFLPEPCYISELFPKQQYMRPVVDYWKGGCIGAVGGEMALGFYPYTFKSETGDD